MSGNTYSTIRTSASRPRTMTSSQSKTETPYSILRSRTATNNSPALGSTTRNSATASENIGPNNKISYCTIRFNSKNNINKNKFIS